MSPELRKRWQRETKITESRAPGRNTEIFKKRSQVAKIGREIAMR